MTLAMSWDEWARHDGDGARRACREGRTDAPRSWPRRPPPPSPRSIPRSPASSSCSTT